MQGLQKVRPRLPGAWDKALDFYRFSKPAKIRLRLIYLISIHLLAHTMDGGLDQTV